uniref:Pentapeptide repeat-containing protein n=1 Tax=Candidatus Kentrum sp. LFY TaxID=2126342 RepID=A0A450U7I0_9GAMM|nr:MAG: Pentapeptide repeat-containing protein [Candidatus Kentron sp. LFY]
MNIGIGPVPAARIRREIHIAGIRRKHPTEASATMMKKLHPMQLLRLCYRILKIFWDYSGLKHVWEMARFEKVNHPDHERSPSLFLWVFGIYAALFGIASSNYETALDRAENRLSAVAAQLSTDNQRAFKKLFAQIPRIQKIRTPLQPSLFYPFEEHFLLASFLYREENREILGWTQEIIESWRDNLSGVNLAEVNLSEANLGKANFSDAILYKANLSGAHLQEANLVGARLWRSNLSGVNLEGGADLSRAEFYAANLSGALLSGANLSGADFWRANLTGAILDAANLSGARFYGADLSNADLWGADLSGMSHWEYIASIEGANIRRIQSPPEGFREWALQQGAVEMDPDAWRRFIQSGAKRAATVQTSAISVSTSVAAPTPVSTSTPTPIPTSDSTSAPASAKVTLAAEIPDHPGENSATPAISVLTMTQDIHLFGPLGPHP